MNCPHLVFGLYPCTRPVGHFPDRPHLAGFTTDLKEEPSCSR